MCVKCRIHATLTRHTTHVETLWLEQVSSQISTRHVNYVCEMPHTCHFNKTHHTFVVSCFQACACIFLCVRVFLLMCYMSILQCLFGRVSLCLCLYVSVSLSYISFSVYLCDISLGISAQCYVPVYLNTFINNTHTIKFLCTRAHTCAQFTHNVHNYTYATHLCVHIQSDIYPYVHIQSDIYINICMYVHMYRVRDSHWQ